MTDREAVTIDTLRIDTKVRPGQASIISTSGKHQLCGKQSRVYVYIRYSAGFGRENLHRQTDFISYFFFFPTQRIFYPLQSQMLTSIDSRKIKQIFVGYLISYIGYFWNIYMFRNVLPITFIDKYLLPSKKLRSEFG